MDSKIFSYSLNAPRETPSVEAVFRYRVRYDWASIVEQDFNASNFVVEPLGFSRMGSLVRDPQSLQDWAKKAMRHLLNRYTGASEVFLAELPVSELERYTTAREVQHPFAF